MIVKLDENKATTEGTREFFRFGEDRFIFWPDRREKVKFMDIGHDKDLYFLDMLELGTWVYWDVLRWNKKQ